MQHLDTISALDIVLSENFQIRATGKFYTHKEIAKHIFSVFLPTLVNSIPTSKIIKIADPFAGDGRLIFWLIEAWLALKLPRVEWDIYLFDVDAEALKTASQKMHILESNGVNLKLTIKIGDSFRICENYRNLFDVVITNPPWELLKPDNRELKELPEGIKKTYIESMRTYDNYLGQEYPLSQPLKKFAGWGTNLSRVGAELSYNICKKNGYTAIVLPASFFADDQSVNIRKKILNSCKIYDIAYYPAEAKLFGKADTVSSTLVFKKTDKASADSKITVFDKSLKIKSSELISFKHQPNQDFIIPLTLGANAINLLEKMHRNLPSWSELENSDDLWAGREIDETGSQNWLSKNEEGQGFIKGKMIDRFKIVEEPSLFVNKSKWTPSTSSDYDRIAWRDVSRPNQKRRVIATIIPKNIVAGNSLGVAYFKDGDKNALFALLAIMSSLCFEFQLRCYLATGHISLSAVRKVHLPSKKILCNLQHLVVGTINSLSKKEGFSPFIEALVARDVYGLSLNELKLLINTFEKLSENEKEQILSEFEKLPVENNLTDPIIKIPNHLSSKLSELDMAIVHAVPPGGNWKNIPETIPSKRISQIRSSFANGEGSRSTYYGRLTSSMPSYTINTYFNRPGNGCHIHYSQDRVLSQREAARLQSFPDNFFFVGSQTAVNTQIGNAVPPLLAFQIAKELTKSIGETGIFIDLFSGAGGMGLGFKWAGWQPILANDIEAKFLETYSRNVHSNVIIGNIADQEIFSLIVDQCRKIKLQYPNKPFWILGGPPCQGFSTAGNKRTMNDKRNSLFISYKELVEKVSPNGFVFENVAGLLNMEKGKIFEQIKAEFKSVMPNLTGWVLNSEDYAIPQRRKRVILIGASKENFSVSSPNKKTSRPTNMDLFSKCWISVGEAISDLPPIKQSEDGSHLNYICDPQTHYQKLMRGLITPEEYIMNF